MLTVTPLHPRLSRDLYRDSSGLEANVPNYDTFGPRISNDTIMSQSIGGIVRDCLESFDSVLSDRAEVEGKVGESLFLSKIKDEQDKFKVWSGNIGAHRKGMSSLDYRLRDASNLRKEVESLLEDLLEALTDGKAVEATLEYLHRC